jgi:hypothetical protein
MRQFSRLNPYILMLVPFYANKFYFLTLHFIILRRGVLLLMIIVCQILMLLILPLVVFLQCRVMQHFQLEQQVKILLKMMLIADHMTLLKIQEKRTEIHFPGKILCQDLHWDRLGSGAVGAVSSVRRPCAGA